MIQRIGSGDNHWMPESVKETEVLLFLVNLNGGMGGGHQEFYCLNDFDPTQKNGLFKIHTIMGNDVIINTNWISTIKVMKMLEVKCKVRSYNKDTKTYTPIDGVKTLTYIINPTDTYKLVGTDSGSIDRVKMNF